MWWAHKAGGVAPCAVRLPLTRKQTARTTRGVPLQGLRIHEGFASLGTAPGRLQPATPQAMSWAALPNRGICALTRSRERAPPSLSHQCRAAHAAVGRGMSVSSRVFHTRTPRPHQFATFACAARPQSSNATATPDERGPGARLRLAGPLDIVWPPERYVPPFTAHPRILLPHNTPVYTPASRSPQPNPN